MGVLLLRVDAGSEIGTGHLLRCLALAQACHAMGGDAVFLSHCESPSLREWIAGTGVGFVAVESPHPDPLDLQFTLSTLRELTGSKEGERPWVVLDGYHFDPGYQRAIQQTGARLLVIDDMAHLHWYHADVLLNQNISAERLAYHCDRKTLLLRGTRYALLRPDFLAWRDRKREVPAVARRLLVTLGGSDPGNVTLKVIQALRQLDHGELEARIAVGAANQYREALRQAVGSFASTVRLLTAVTDMPGLMAWADVAISAGGSTCWELAFMGVPMVLLVLADNQRHIATRMAADGAAISLGRASALDSQRLASALHPLLLDPNRRRVLAERAQSLVDGCGASRVAAAMEEVRA